MNQNHIKKLKETLPQSLDKEHWVGFNILKWWQYVEGKLEHNYPQLDLPNKRLTRSNLKAICNKDSKYSDLACLVAVMAWGGKNRKHGITLFNRFNDIQPIIHKMRQGELSHIDAYKSFYDIWNGKGNLGMGAAYFTKLIFFCEPSHKGYIMDQWTSKSINLLTNSEVVYLTAGHVNKKNTYENYKRFCDLTESIANKLSISGEDTEIAMFSKGGRKKWQWRQYIIDNTL